MKYIQNINQIWRAWTVNSFKNTIVTAFILSLYTKLTHGAPYQENQEDPCDPPQLARCAKHLHVFSDSTELTFVASKAELDLVCPELHEGLRCIHNYTTRCMTLPQRNHFHKMYRGTVSVIKELCNEGPYQQEFLKHLPCMRTAVDGYEMCTIRYQMALQEIQNLSKQNVPGQEDTIRNVCRSFSEYIKCGTDKMQQFCGYETAEFTRSFMDRMASKLIKMYCLEYDQYETSSTKSLNSYSWSIFFTTLLASLTIAARNLLVS